MVLSAAVVFVFLLPPQVSSAADLATSLYIKTIASMQALPEPPFVTYRFVTEDNSDFGIGLTVFDHEVWLIFGGKYRATAWGVVHRESDSASVVVDDSGHRYVSDRSFFDPTWYSGYHAMRDGMVFVYPVKQPLQSRVPTPEPSASFASPLKTIAQQEVVRANLYSVRDAGPATCPNGDPGRALTFTANVPATQYQLTAAVVDLAPDLFCVLQYTLPAFYGGPLSDDQYYGMMDGYWVRTGGTFRRTLAMNIPMPVLESEATTELMPQRDFTYTQRRVYALRYQLIDMAFPAEVPGDLRATATKEPCVKKSCFTGSS